MATAFGVSSDRYTPVTNSPLTVTGNCHADERRKLTSVISITVISNLISPHNYMILALTNLSNWYTDMFSLSY